MIVDAWIQHPTPRFLGHDMFASLRRWMGGEIPAQLPVALTLGAMDAAGVDAAPDDVAAAVAAARLTGSTAAVMRGGLWLARQLEERYPVVREAFAAGDLGEAQARVIVTAAR